MNTINNRILATQLKNTVASIQQLISDQMVSHKTKNLADTDFSSTEKLSTESNFAVVRVCASDAGKNCWRTSATDSTKIQYRGINGNTGSDAANAMAMLSSTLAAGNRTVVLKNGVTLAYSSNPAEDYVDGKDKLLGIFFVDLNGVEKPNISGRDFFWFYVTEHGKIVGLSDLDSYKNNSSLDKKISFCKNGNAPYCYEAIVDSGWKMPY